MENTEIKTNVEMVNENETQLAVIIQQSGLERTKANHMLEKFQNFFQMAAEWERKTELCKVTDISQVAEMKMAREGRLFLKAKRIEVEKVRKELKEQSLREGKAIDGIANVIKALIEPIEEKLESYEKFPEIEKARVEQENRTKREEALLPFGVDITSFNLGTMSEETFQSLFDMSKKNHEDKIEAEKKAEEERIAREKAEAEERERQRIENERLKKEAEEREAQMKAEREKLEAEKKAAEEKAHKEKEELERKAAEEKAKQEEALRKEREERAKVEAELAAKAEAEKKAAEEKAAEERRKQNAPDKEKLYILSSSIASIQLPEVSGEEAKKIIAGVKDLLGRVSKYISDNANNL